MDMSSKNMANNIHYDARWIGDHGIGRFAREIQKRILMNDLNIEGSPSSPLDIFRFTYALAVKTHHSDIVFSPGFNVPIAMFRTFVFTIMDLNHIDLKGNDNILKTIYYNWFLRSAARRAAAVLTISEFSRKRIIEWAGVCGDKVVNVGCGVSSNYKFNVAAASLGYQYLLCVGNRKPHKNEIRVVEAFSRANIANDIRLLFTGDSTENLTREINKHNISDRITFLGRVDEQDLPSVYKGALALVFPSLYEGFGLPVVEAMACGTPVLTSNVTSLPEVAGDAALLVDPLSVELIADGIKKICEDNALREKLIQKGLKQAHKYKWDVVASRVRMVLSRLEEVR
jgi:glycosyltransferase involved in cell wall biosynthesis